MKIGPFLAVIFAFFLIAIFPYYAGNDEHSYVISDEDGDGITDDKTNALEKLHQKDKILMKMDVLIMP